MFKIGLGSRVKDSVTGFTGIVVCRCEWMNGCIRYTVQGEKLNKEGQIADAPTFDEPQLIVLKKKDLTANAWARTGGPKPSMARVSNPPRR
jgi:hypothetical protein